MKSDRALLKKCCNMGEYIEEKCLKERASFYGSCHAGAEELVMPIFVNGKRLIGILSAGNFQSHNSKSIQRFNRINDLGIFEKEFMLDCYKKLPEVSPLSIDLLEKALGIAVKYLADLYAKSVNENILSYAKFDTNENGILGKVLDIISKHSNKP
jgi:ligand-binding sensor protein